MDLPERTLYEMMCRGDIERPLAALAQLKCRYVTNSSPFLTIGPLKLEEMNHKPYIVVYHDVLFDDEIELFQNMAKPRVSYPKKVRKNQAN
jgi:prolyl 4-hydroxylase